MSSFDNCPVFVQEYILHVIDVEGGYVDNENDSGGKTKYGITESLARKYNYKGNMKDLPLDFAKDVYAKEFYFKPKLYLIKSLNIQKEVFDSSVNVGSKRAISWLQRSLNVFNNKQKYYRDLLVDGVMGNNTSNTLNNFLNLRGDEGESVLLKALNCLQGAFYIELAEKREKDETFVYGWLKQRVD